MLVTFGRMSSHENPFGITNAIFDIGDVLHLNHTETPNTSAHPAMMVDMRATFAVPDEVF